MAEKQEQQTAVARPEQSAAADEKLRALVRSLAKMAAEADYEASMSRTSQPRKGSSS